MSHRKPLLRRKYHWLLELALRDVSRQAVGWHEVYKRWPQVTLRGAMLGPLVEAAGGKREFRRLMNKASKGHFR